MPPPTLQSQIPTTANSQSPSYTTVELHTPTTLLDSPHLPALFSLINYTFTFAANRTGHSNLPCRLRTHEQLGEEVGPDGFILVMFQQPSSKEGQAGESSLQTKEEGFRFPQGQRIIGSVSAKPYITTKPGEEPGDVVHVFFKRPPPPSSSTVETENTTPQWEILAMVVDRALQGRGLATQLMNLTVDEIKRRCGSNMQDPVAGNPGLATDSNNDGKNGEKKQEILLLLSTMKGVNEVYYGKRGWTATATREFPKALLGSTDGFHVVEMYKRVLL